ncbi:flagellar basal body protein, partial [Pseudomonas sp. DKN 2791]|uniref:flagellar basal body protein n=1 Tax=Pseudomonas sp. DKN 2791 TaxID=3060956 RepID=UPI00349FE7E1
MRRRRRTRQFLPSIILSCPALGLRFAHPTIEAWPARVPWASTGVNVLSLYSALYAGVSGLNAQSSAMAAVADNITNI